MSVTFNVSLLSRVFGGLFCGRLVMVSKGIFVLLLNSGNFVGFEVLRAVVTKSSIF
jgi:hypothetical protein